MMLGMFRFVAPADPVETPGPDVDWGPGRGEMWRRALRYPNLVLGVAILLAVILMAVLAPVIAPYGANAQHIAIRLQPPSSLHWFGVITLKHRTI